MRRRSVGLALAGGGPLGAIYEIGALLALEEALQGLSLTDCNVYVGVSSGAFLAAGLANGISARAMHGMFIESDTADDPFEPDVLMRPALTEYAHRLSSLPRLISAALGSYLEAPGRKGLLESFQELAAALPTGLFDNRSIGDYLTRLFSAPGRTNDFRLLRRKLFVVATDLDSGEEARFGAPGWDSVPIARAVQASSALPGLYPPVEIDGRVYVDGTLRKTLHASVALDQGAKLLICINPLVPFDARASGGLPAGASLAEGGLPTVLSQTFRSIIHSRMQVGMERYRRLYPDADVVMFEPSRDDSEMFFANVFSYVDRRRLCEHAYQRTRADLLRRAAQLEPVLARAGIGLDTAVLADSSRRPFPAATPPQRSLGRCAIELSRTLDRLETILRADKRAAMSAH